LLAAYGYGQHFAPFQVDLVESASATLHSGRLEAAGRSTIAEIAELVELTDR
jgi:hypothetical protein